MDLSGSSSLVNATGLNLASTSISGTAVAVQLSATDYRTGAYLDQDSSQTYRIATASGNTVSINVQGDTNGLTGNEIVSQLNSGLSGTGLTASLSSADGSLQISGSGSFAVAVDAKTGPGAQIQAAITDANAVLNTGNTTSMQAPRRLTPPPRRRSPSPPPAAAQSTLRSARRIQRMSSSTN